MYWSPLERNCVDSNLMANLFHLLMKLIHASWLNLLNATTGPYIRKIGIHIYLPSVLFLGALKICALFFTYFYDIIFYHILFFLAFNICASTINKTRILSLRIE